jgi:hypothetical protein
MADKATAEATAEATLVARARDLAPVLAERAAQAERDRRVPKDTDRDCKRTRPRLCIQRMGRRNSRLSRMDGGHVSG